MPEMCSQRSTAEMSVARQWLAETRFHGNEYACINHIVARQQRITEDSQFFDVMFCIQSA
jgi:hypothetical protein